MKHHSTTASLSCQVQGLWSRIPCDHRLGPCGAIQDDEHSANPRNTSETLAEIEWFSWNLTLCRVCRFQTHLRCTKYFSVTHSWIEMKATCWLRKTFVNIMVLYTGICTGVRGCHGDYLVFAGITWGCRHGNLGCGRWMEGGRRDRLSTFQACL